MTSDGEIEESENFNAFRHSRARGKFRRPFWTWDLAFLSIVLLLLLEALSLVEQYITGDSDQAANEIWLVFYVDVNQDWEPSSKTHINFNRFEIVLKTTTRDLRCA